MSIYIYVHTNIHIYICVCVCLVPCVFKDSLKQNHHGAFNDDLMLLTLWHFAAFFPENLPGMVNGWWMNPCKFQHRHTVAHSSIPRATSCETEVLDVLWFFQGPWKVGPVGQISWNETQDLPFFFLIRPFGVSVEKKQLRMQFDCNTLRMVSENLVRTENCIVGPRMCWIVFPFKGKVCYLD